MNDFAKAVFGLLIPLLGTTLGAAMAFFMKGEMKRGLQKALLGFASGVMIAASVWSLLIPAIEMAENAGKIAWMPAVVGFLLGMGFLLLLDTLIPHLHLDSDHPEGKPSGMGKSTMLVLAVTLHNIPEGMAVGVVLAGMLNGGSGITMASAFALAIGIAIQNFPEGAIISMPLVSSGLSRGKAFRNGFLSGIVEPIGALLTILLILDCDKTLVEKGLLDSSGSITRSSYVGLTDDILAVYAQRIVDVIEGAGGAR